MVRCQLTRCDQPTGPEQGTFVAEIVWINFLAFAEGMYISAIKRGCAKILLLEGIEVVRHSETGQVAISVKVPLSLEKKETGQASSQPQQ